MEKFNNPELKVEKLNDEALETVTGGAGETVVGAGYDAVPVLPNDGDPELMCSSPEGGIVQPFKNDERELMCSSPVGGIVQPF